MALVQWGADANQQNEEGMSQLHVHCKVSEHSSAVERCTEDPHVAISLP